MKAVLLFLFWSLSVLFLQARTILISSDQNLQKAIDSTHDFDTLILKSGTYRSVNTEIKKPLTIIGENFPVLDGQLEDEVLVVTSNNVSIIGIEVRNTKCGSMKDYAGIHVNKSQNVNIENCKLDNTMFGIYLSD